MKYLCLFLFFAISLSSTHSQTLLTNNRTIEVEHLILKLKTALLKNLLADDQINSINERVEIEFKDDQILIDEKVLNYQLFEKYTFMLKGFGFTIANRYVVNLQADYISLSAYDKEGKIQLMIDAGEGKMQL